MLLKLNDNYCVTCYNVLNVTAHWNTVNVLTIYCIRLYIFIKDLITVLIRMLTLANVSHQSSSCFFGGAASSGAAIPYTPSVLRNLESPSTVLSPLYSA